ncbi:MAG: preprotein translocase subunit SecF [archaeon GW2011_AR3]|nr:MAG: preprotein translocase subunit SecF [archaeon GW2011_AR3]MBS3110151.1 MMPL family transporter [Candidatus Woesearchaeota archaeon]
MSKRSRRKRLKLIAMAGAQEAGIAADSDNNAKHDARGEAAPRKPSSNAHPKIANWYFKYNKQLLVIPVLLLLLSIVQIGMQTATTGDFIQKGISLKGGITITVPSDMEIDLDSLQGKITSEFQNVDLSIRRLESANSLVGYVIDADLQETEEVDRLVNIVEMETRIKRANYGLETVQPSLGESFFKEAGRAILFAFLLMSIVVFIAFRTIIPSFAVIISVFADMVMTLAAVNLLEVKISTGGIAAFLMLIGYSVDTDILLSSRVLRNQETSLMDRIMSSFKTGMTMVATTVTAATIAFLFSESETIRQIMLIIIIGMVADVFNTWITNTAILKWYVERKAARKHGQG